MEILITMETDVTQREGTVRRMPLHELAHPISSSRGKTISIIPVPRCDRADETQ